jgi:hypothetical protein
MASLPGPERRSLGRRAAEVVARWGPERFAIATIEALQIAVAAGHVAGAAVA